MQLKNHPNVRQVLWSEELVDGTWRPALKVVTDLCLDRDHPRYCAELIAEVQRLAADEGLSWPDIATIRIIEAGLA